MERVNCRHLDICSVDPPGCTDIDDALHAKLLPNGNYEVSRCCQFINVCAYNCIFYRY